MSILLNGERYGLEIRNEYELRSRDSLPLGSTYVTLERMETIGFLESRQAHDADAQGNRRRYYKLTGHGKRALDSFEKATVAVLGAIKHA